jgi:hypothetical protein
MVSSLFIRDEEILRQWKLLYVSGVQPAARRSPKCSPRVVSKNKNINIIFLYKFTK